MIARFFIDRPIFASVLSIVITLVGGIALWALPIAEFPQIAPPTVQVDCNYPGASAQVVAESVATPIEQMVNGVENMLYMASQCTNDGAYTLTVTFKHGVDQNMAQVLVQNRVALATPLLPDVLKQSGVIVKKRSPDILMVIALNSDGRYDQLYLSNYALMHIKDELARMPGVSDVILFGQRDYSMRIWVDPQKLAARNLSPADVAAAVREQNAPVATGQIGQPPLRAGQSHQFPLSTQGRLAEVGEFENIIIRTTPDGRVLRLKDVARVALGAKNEDTSAKVNGKPTVGLAVFQLPDANALETGNNIKRKIEELRADFPSGVSYIIRYDTTPFIRESIGEVFKTLNEAVLLVALVVLLFLQNWRSAIIPLLTVPVAIIGTFAAMKAFGFSINNLTLFGLVLAVGIVVDDAIVVVEAVEHQLERGLGPRAATIRALEEVSGPVLAIGLVLTAIFVPCAFMSGIVGQFFRQFAVTIAVSTVISTFNSLTLSPALAAVLLRPRTEETAVEPLPRLAFAVLGALAAGFSLQGMGMGIGIGIAVVLGAALGWVAGRPLNRLLSGFFGAFNAAFRALTRGYGRLVGGLLRQSVLVLAGYGGLLVLTSWGFNNTPTGFIPAQDMGYLLVNVQLPDAASLERTQATMDEIEQLCFTVPGIRYTQTITGQSLLLSANGSNFGTMIIILDEFARRRTPELYGERIAAKLRRLLDDRISGAMTAVLGPPPVRGVGRAGGYKLMVEDRGDSGMTELQRQAEKLVDAANRAVLRDDGSVELLERGQQWSATMGQKLTVGNTTPFRANVPQLYADANRSECLAKEVDLQELFAAWRIYLGSLYVNDFNLFGRTWQVIIQADAPFRNQLDDIKLLKVRNAHGAMIPIAALADIREINGPLVLTRYNMYSAASINGASAAGISSGKAIEVIEALANQELLPTMSCEWTEMAYLERQAGDTALLVFGLAVAIVFLVLAAQYESWSLPLAIILVVPMCLLGSLIGVRVAKDDINIFTQIGFVVLVGLASKNAILIVEYARAKRQAGIPRRQATLEACLLRFRPIVMTSLSFILGVLPLVLSQGAGAEMRRTLGTTVFSGMLGVTFFGVLLTPVFFYVIDWLGGSRFFTSPLMCRLNELSLGILSARALRQSFRRPRSGDPVTAVPMSAPSLSSPGPLLDKDFPPPAEDAESDRELIEKL